MGFQNTKTAATLQKVYSIHRSEALRRGTLESLTNVGEVIVDSVCQKYTVEQVEENGVDAIVTAISHDSGETCRLSRSQTYRESRTMDSLGIFQHDPRHDELVAFNRGYKNRIDASPTLKTAVEIFSSLRRFIADTGMEGDAIGRVIESVDQSVSTSLKVAHERGYEKHEAAGGIIVRVISSLDYVVREETFELPLESDGWTSSKRSKRLREAVEGSRIALRSEPGVADTIWRLIYDAVKYASGGYSLWRNPDRYEDCTAVEIIAIPSHREQLEKSFIAEGGLSPVASGWL